MDISGPITTYRMINSTTTGVLRSRITVTDPDFTNDVTLSFGAVARAQQGGVDVNAIEFACVGGLTVNCTSGDMAGRIKVRTGIINAVNAGTMGNIRADILAGENNPAPEQDYAGSIISVLAVGGEIRGIDDVLDANGQPADNVAYPTRIRIHSYRNIARVEAKRICAHIDANIELVAATGTLQRLFASDATSSGGFFGTVSASFYRNSLSGSAPDEPCVEVSGVQAGSILSSLPATAVQSPIVVGSGRGLISVWGLQAHVSPKFPRIESAGSLGPIVIRNYGSTGGKARIIAVGDIERIESNQTGSGHNYVDVTAANGTVGNVVSPANIDFAGTWNVGRIQRSDIGGWIGANTTDQTATFNINRVEATDIIRVRGGLRANSSINVGGASPNHQNLAGQILFNYGSTTEDTTKWVGTVTAGTQVLGPTPSYDELSDTFGGGAVGIQTPRINKFETGMFYPALQSEIIPPPAGAVTPWSFPQGLINYGFAPGQSGCDPTTGLVTPPGFRVSYYGPIVWPTGAASPYSLVLVTPGGDQIWVAQMTEVTIDRTVNSGIFRHDLVIRGLQNVPLQPGTYRLSLGAGLKHDFGDGSLLTPSGFVPGSSASTPIEFTVLADVNRNGTADFNETPAPDCPRWGGCWADFNLDGFLDFFDYSDYVACFEGTCPPDRTADFNGDGFVDFFDYDAFNRWFESGC